MAPALLVVLAASLGLDASGARANNVYTITGFADSTAACDGTVCPSLRSAVVAANRDPGSSVQLSAGNYTLGGGAGLRVGTGDLELSADVTIDGRAAVTTTITQTDGEDRVFTILRGSAVIRGVTITGGHQHGASGSSGAAGGAADGGGIYVAPQADLTLIGSRVTNNVVAGGGASSVLAAGGAGGSALGGAIMNLGIAVVDNTIVEGNTATGGAGGNGSSGGPGGEAAGAAIENNGTLTLQDGTRVLSNSSFGGTGGTGGVGPGGVGGQALGAVDSVGSLAVTDSNVAFNHAQGGAGGDGAGRLGGDGGAGYGGGLSIDAGSLTLTSSTVISDTARDAVPGNGGAGGPARGGGLYVLGQAIVVNATFDANNVGVRRGGQGLGGGIFGSPTATVTVASVTLDANTITGGGAGGNIDSPTASLADSIVAAGSASSANDCAGPVGADVGHNLTDVPGGQCGLSASRADLTQTSPMLEPLAPNGGYAETMALAPGSPAIGNGGPCRDPSSSPPNQRLLVDQRGEPRRDACDIGAFQDEPPQLTLAPKIFGIAKVRTTLTCSHGIWVADGTLGYVYSWLDRGRPILNGRSDTLRVTRGDLGRRLTCEVRATNLYGQATAVSEPFSIPRVPRIRHASESRRTWRLGSEQARINHGGASALGTLFRLSLNERARLVLAFYRAHHVRGRAVAELSLRAAAGPDRVFFDGRLKRRRELSPGRYTVVITAISAGVNSRSAILTFTAVGG